MSYIKIYTNHRYEGSILKYDDWSWSFSGIRYTRGDSLGFTVSAKEGSYTTYNDVDYYYFPIEYTSWTNKSTGESVTARAIDGTDLTFNVSIYVKDINGTYYKISNRSKRLFSDSDITLLSTDQIEDYGFESSFARRGAYSKIYFTSNYDYYWMWPSSFTVPDYADGLNLYAELYVDFSGKLYPTEYSYDAITGDFRRYIYSKDVLGSFKTSPYTMKQSSITYPTFCNSSKTYVTAPKVTNSTSVILYRSVDNGLNWTQIYQKNNSTTNSVTETNTWSVDCDDENGNNYATRQLKFGSIPPITLSYHDTDAINQALTTTHGIKYKAVYTALGSNGTSNATTLEVAPSTEMQVMDLTLPGTITFSEKADYFKSSGQTYSITKTTVADITRIKFRHLFKHTSLPNTTVPGSSTDLQDYPDRETNMGQWLTTPNGTYEYQIVPILDGSECYTSSIGQKYEKINFVKAGHKLEAIRPIEMGSNKPVKIKLLTTPSKTEFPSGASVKFYVANNGNDSNIVWEELPNSCIGTPSNPNVDQFQFSNTTKTADTWKVMIKIVADKNTATTDFKLNNFTVVINGGEKDTSVPGYKYIANTILTDNATSVRIDIPQGYKKIRIEGYMTTTGDTNTGYNVTVNGIASYTDNKMRTVLLQGSSPWTNSADSTVFLNIPIGGGAYNHLTIDLFNDGTRWIGSLLSIGDNGLGASHNRIKLTEGLSYITLACDASGYIAKNTEITIMGVD